MRGLRLALYLFGFCLACNLLQGYLWAGLTATEVVVVVNGQSIQSRTLANHFAQLRRIPAVNIIVLTDVPDRESCSVDDFREKILKPLLQEIQQRNLDGHVQCIAYSADFPTAIDISADLAKVEQLHTVFTKVASINGLTYLYELVLRKDPAYITPEINFYARRPLSALMTNQGGAKTEQEWQDITLLAAEQRFAEASQKTEELADQLPHQYPLWYQAAAYAARADQPDRALKLLEQSIQVGWTSGSYLKRDPQFEKLRSNDQFLSLLDLLEQDDADWQSVAPFNARSSWSPNGVEFTPSPKVQAVGMRYLLSTVLGVTRGSGCSLQEAIEVLKRSSRADYTHPEGGFYFASTLDVRTKTRQPNFNQAVKQLQGLGFEAEVVLQEYPKNKPVLGAQLGSPQLDWSKSGSQLLPGSIVDNLTSTGGVMSVPNSQTSLTHFLVSGAAGSSGTVTEPYSVQFKFPTPFLYLYYAQGVSLVEAFYQSVSGPYQLLIVGDPLCQPFSIAPNSKIDSSLRSIATSGVVNFRVNMDGPNHYTWLGMSEPPAKRRVQLRPSKIAVQIDGAAPQGGNAQPNVNIKMDRQSAGYHELQVVQIGDDPLKQRSMQVIPVWIGEGSPWSMKVTEVGQSTAVKTVPLSREQVQVHVELPQVGVQVVLLHYMEQVAEAQVQGQKAVLDLSLPQLGKGPVRLQVRATLADGSTVLSLPFWLEVTD